MLSVTCGERKICSTIKNFQNIMNMIVGQLVNISINCAEKTALKLQWTWTTRPDGWIDGIREFKSQ